MKQLKDYLILKQQKMWFGSARSKKNMPTGGTFSAGTSENSCSCNTVSQAEFLPVTKD
jgi:hypothetical protein